VSHVLIRRNGTLIDISPDGKNPLDPALVDALKPLLTYQHKKLLRGHDRYGPDGIQRNIDIETRYMYALEEGRLVTGFGFLTAIAGILQRRGVTPHYYDINPVKDPAIYEPDWENVRRHIKFRARQEECLQCIAANPCGIIDATMGFGKTFIFEAMAHLYPKAKIDIVVRPVNIAERILQQLTRSVPNVGMHGGGYKQHGPRVNVYTAASCHHSPGDADFLLVDEVHQVATDETTKAIGQTWRYARNFGFSGTPHARMDGAHAQLQQFFGQTIFKLTYQEAVALGLVVPIRVRWLPIRMTYNPAENRTGVSKTRHAIWRNDVRNATIAADVRQTYPDPNTQILILTATVEHAIMLWQHLPEFALCYGQSISADDIARYKRNHLLPDNFIMMDAARRKELQTRFGNGEIKRVIATDVWATGTDFEKLQVLYRADARGSEIMDAQGPARVSRISEGKGYGEVVDCYDTFDNGFRRQSDSRRHHYKNLGWEQIKPGNGGTF